MPEQSVPVQQLLWGLVADAALAFQAVGVPSPRYDAEELAAHALGVPRSGLRSVQVLDEATITRFRAAVARRQAREPLQHILGTAAFRHVEVAVGPGVFVPRPETEVVAGFAIDRAREVVAEGRSPLVVDLCTGSGVIAISVAGEVPEATVHAVEVSEEALVWARRNVDGSGVRLQAGDATAADVLAELDGTVDVVVSNPPYIPADGVVRDPEVLAYDPAVALWGNGPDGLGVLRGVAVRAQALLRPGGWFVVEHADVQGAAVVAALRDQGGWVEAADHRDLTGRDRYAVARRDAPTSAPTSAPSGDGGDR